MTAVRETALPLPLARRGKVRDVYMVDDDRLLLVATDRVSAFDIVMAEPIPRKGAVLTQLTAWWLRQLDGIVPHHMISADTDEIIAAVPRLASHRPVIDQRSMLVHATRVFPIECVMRGYITGSAWKEYKASGTLAGEPLPPGLRESDRLIPSIFSPAHKAETGHDENITPSMVAAAVGTRVADELELLSRRIYAFGSATTESRGIIVADTKFEFGERGGRVTLIDEVLTPDSSRFWPANSYAPGRPQPSFDKQPLRDYLETQRAAGRWNGDTPPPALPASVVEATSHRYLNAYERLTGHPLPASGDVE
jgi:phosphoribosylaminoimidazole-succinocarboxamide synthase